MQEIPVGESGKVLCLGTEVHFEGRGISRARIRAILGPLIEQYGYLTTCVLHELERDRKFIERFGFKHTWSDESRRYYMLTELPGIRRKPCP